MMNRRSVSLELSMALLHCVLQEWVIPEIVAAYFLSGISQTQYVAVSACVSMIVFLAYVVLANKRRKKEVVTADEEPVKKNRKVQYARAAFYGMIFGAFGYFTVQILLNGLNSLIYGLTGELLADASFQYEASLSTVVKWVALYAVVAAIAEEMVFRGMIWKGVSGKNIIAAFVLSGLTFALAHDNIPQIITAFLLGLVWCLLFNMSGTILLPCVAHIVYNAMDIIFTNVILPPYSILNLYIRYTARNEYTAAAFCFFGIGLVLFAAMIGLFYLFGKKGSVSGEAETSHKERFTAAEWVLAGALVLLQAGVCISKLIQQGM